MGNCALEQNGSMNPASNYGRIEHKIIFEVLSDLTTNFAYNFAANGEIPSWFSFSKLIIIFFAGSHFLGILSNVGIVSDCVHFSEWYIYRHIFIYLEFRRPALVFAEQQERDSHPKVEHHPIYMY